jgi:hypothetical protein
VTYTKGWDGMTEPSPGSYGCVTIPWLYHSFFGRKIRLPNLLGYAIMLQTWSKYCHAFIYIGDGKIVEAQPKGAAISSLAKYNLNKVVWSTDALLDSQRQAVVAKALSLVGKPYGFLDIFAQALVRFGFRNVWLWHQVEREDRYICSQLVATCGEAADAITWLCGEDNAALVTPAQLAKRLAKRLRSNLSRWARALAGAYRPTRSGWRI